MKKGRVVALTGAGISAESGLKTFRDSNGLWEEHRVEDVATPEAWHKDMELVLRFYNLRRQQLAVAEPNQAHRLLAELESDWHVDVVTQNVDNLHERAGSSHVIHLHGELTKVRSMVYPEEIIDIGYRKLRKGELCSAGEQLRPNIVWFGESVPLIEKAADVVGQADVLLVIGTSLNVYPAAGLIHYRNAACQIVLIDPDTSMKRYEQEGLRVINEKATNGMQLVAQLLSEN